MLKISGLYFSGQRKLLKVLPNGANNGLVLFLMSFFCSVWMINVISRNALAGR